MRINRHWFAVVLAAAIAALTAGSFLAQQPNSSAKDEVALRAAIEKETVQGDLPGAIEAYKNLSASKDRSIAARALLGMAESYQKLGNTESRRIYERIVRDYQDQENAFATARARLSGTGAIGARPANDRVVLAGDNVFGDGSVSPDGRYMTDIDYNWTGNLVLHDLVTGKSRALTGNKDWSVGNAASSTFSPDGKRIAYGWRTYGTPATNDLRIINLEGPDIPQPRRLITSNEVRYYEPKDWSRDGKWLAVTIDRTDLTKQIALIGVEDATVRVLKTVGWRGPRKILFSPDGKHIAYSLPGNENEAQHDVFVMSIDGPNEMAVVQGPANDILMGWSPNGAHLIFASDRTGSTGLWAVSVKDGKAPASAFLLKPNIGLVSPIGITAAGALMVVRDSSTLGLYLAPIDLNTGKLTGPAILQSFWSEYPSWSPDGAFLSYASTGSGNGRTLAIRSMASGEVRELRPALEYFRFAAWGPDSKWLITDGRDFKGRRSVFRVDAQTGATSVIVDQGDFAFLSPDGKKIFYTAGGWLVERDLTSGQTRQIVRGGGQGRELSPDGRLFATIRSDEGSKTSTLLVVSVDNGESREVHQVRAPAAFRPFTNISWTPDGRALLSVKSGERDEGKELWLVPVYGGAPRKLDVDISGWEMGLGIRLHPNGRQIAFFSGKSSREAWVYENVTAGIKP